MRAGNQKPKNYPVHCFGEHERTKGTKDIAGGSMGGRASRQPFCRWLRLGSFATIVATCAFFVPGAPSAESGIKPTESRRAALKEPPATMPQSRFLAPHLAPAPPMTAKRKETTNGTSKQTATVKPKSRIIAPVPLRTPAAPKISKPAAPKVPRPAAPDHANQPAQVRTAPAVAPPPPAITAPGDATPTSKLASLPTARTADTQENTGDELYRLAFARESVMLGEENSKLLDKLAKRLQSDASLRLQLRGFADGGVSASQARRESLFRVLAVRTYLMKQGVASTRMDVRALGRGREDAPANRVDILVNK
jgi:outer membrane protein OmpA-like peptidoglycan-associated protein